MNTVGTKLVAKRPAPRPISGPGGTKKCALFALAQVCACAITTVADTPPPGESQRMAWDAANHELVMFGFIGPNPTNTSECCVEFDETWVWQGSGWLQKHPSTHPTARGGPGLAFDGARGQTVLFGGYIGVGNQHLADTWTWDGLAWNQVLPAHHPSGRRGANLVYDAARQEVVFFGGHDTLSGIQPYNDTWVWNGNDWTQRIPAQKPTPRYGFLFAYDEARSETVLFGGSVSGGGQGNFGETWVWNGTNWTQKSPTTSPPNLAGTAFAYDPIRQEVVMFGGATSAGSSVGYNETWTWNGIDWSLKSPATRPPAVYAASAAFDPARGAVVLYGGTLLPVAATPIQSAETWLWDGTNWSQYVPQPAGIAVAPLNQVANPGQTVTFSVDATGDAPLSYQWLFNGTNITGATTATLTLPGVNCEHAGVYSVVVANSLGTTNSSATLSLLGLKMYAGLTICGQVGSPYRVEYTNVMGGGTNWQTLVTIPSLPSSPYLFFDLDSPNTPKRFYRAIPDP